MSIFNIPFDSITVDTINGLIGNVSEGTQIEFKKEIHNNNTDEKKEFLADVVRFASTMGGDIIYGISEKHGVADTIEPIILQDLDQFKLSLSQIIRDGISPSITFLLREVSFGDGYLIILRIFKLFPGPPMVIFRNNSKFFARGAAGKYQMNYFQIRNLFLSSSTINDTFKQFRSDRINHFLTGVEGNNPTNPFLLFFVYTINENNFNINDLLKNSIINSLFPVDAGGGDYGFNIDGFAMFSSKKPTAENYLTQNQLFYNGTVELYNERLLSMRAKGTNPGIILINIKSVENNIIHNFLNLIKFYRINSILSPYICNLCLINVKNSIGMFEDTISFFDFKKNFRDNLVFKEYIVVPNPERPVDCLKSIFDDLWRAYGVSKSSSFNNKGEFKRFDISGFI